MTHGAGRYLAIDRGAFDLDGGVPSGPEEAPSTSDRPTCPLHEVAFQHMDAATLSFLAGKFDCSVREFTERYAQCH